ncbi:MAG TPA: BadF/BadG/BcrA/BcrD ATPase family protein [Anaerolineales bacterium]|nr:BadF/BadG/BcrA/BcrD ATPase family protein [Anaerolineales bacterium]
MAKQFFLGLDVGSSKTHALIADKAGDCVGFGRSGGGNHQTAGYDGLAEVLKQSFEQACHMANITFDQIAGAGFGIAGYDFPSDRAAHLHTISNLGLRCLLEVVNDGVNGLLAGTTHGIGVNITAGSGVNCYGIGPNGEQGRIVGNGTSFGEFGGGYEIIWKGLHMVNYAWIKRIPPTALTAIYLEATGAKDELDLMEGISNQQYHLFPYIAIQIFEAALTGDAAAGEVIRWAGEELGWLTVAVTRQIGMENEEVEIVQSGGIFEGGALISEPMCQIILRHIPNAQISRLDGPPVVGSVLLGMKMAGVDGNPIRQTLIQGAKELVLG